MVEVGHHGAAVSRACCLQGFFGEACDGGGHAEDAHDGRAEVPRVGAGLAWQTDVVGDRPTLAVGRPPHGQGHACCRLAVEQFHRVAGRIDVGVGGLQPFVHHDVAAGSDVEPGGGGQRRIRPHADSEDHQVRRQHVAGAQAAHQHIAIRLEGGHGVADKHLHAGLSEGGLHGRGHVGVERRQDLRCHLHHADRASALLQLFGHFQADESRAHDHHAAGVAGGLADAVHIGQRTQDPDPVVVGVGQVRAQRDSPGGKDQLVVGDLAFGPIAPVAGQNGLPPAVNRHRLGVRQHIHVEQRAEGIRPVERHPRAVRDLAADEVRHAAGRHRDIG